MADNTPIEWTDATANVVNGCSLASPGCTNCYAMRLAGTRLRNHPSREGLTVQTKAGPVWNGGVRFNERALQDVLRWRQPRMIFWNAHGDLFHESVPDAWIDRCFAAMALTPHHIHQVLTKRSARMRAYMEHFVQGQRSVVEAGKGMAMPGKLAERLSDLRQRSPACTPTWVLPNVWLGVSVEDQKRADERVPDLLATPAAIRWLSCEPLLGPVDFTRVKRFPVGTADKEFINAIAGRMWTDQTGLPNPDPAWAYPGRPFSEGARGLDWIVVGGESGPGARPMHPKWARSLRDQCAEAGVPFFFKQWGEWAPQVGAVDGWTIPDDPEISRYDHCDWLGDGWSAPFCKGWQDEVDGDTVSRVGKKRAGRLLDGVEHNGTPEVRHG